jgi:protocatechuate 3,4-dioxygenase beta subunit
MNKHRYSRRGFSKRVGLVTAAGLTASPLVYARNILPTPEQVEGPFHPIVDQADKDLDLVMISGHTRPASGEVIMVQGQVRNLSGKPLAGVEVDVWQANHFGRYAHEEDPNPAQLDPDFQGWGIVQTDAAKKDGVPATSTSN